MNRGYISASGNVENSGTVRGNDISVTSADAINTGKMEAAKITVEASGSVKNKGTVNANELKTKSVSLLNEGDISAGKGEMSASSSIRNDGKLHSDDLTLHTGRLDNNGVIEAGKGKFESSGDILNSDTIIAGNLTLKGRNIVNREKKVIFAADNLSLDAEGVIENSGAELLSQGSMKLKADTVENRTGKIKAAGTVTIEAGTVNNIGKVSNFGKHRVYWESWNGIRYDSWDEMVSGWYREKSFDPDDPPDKEATFHYLLGEYGGSGKPSYILNELADTVKARMWYESHTMAVNSAEFPAIPLVNRIHIG